MNKLYLLTYCKLLINFLLLKTVAVHNFVCSWIFQRCLTKIFSPLNSSNYASLV